MGYSERSDDGAELLANELPLTHLAGRVFPKQFPVERLGVIVGTLEIARNVDRTKQVSLVHLLLPVVFDEQCGAS